MHPKSPGRTVPFRLCHLPLAVAAVAMFATTAQAAPPPAVPPGNPATPVANPMGVDPDTAIYRPGKGLQFNSRDGRFSTVIRPRAMWLYTAQKSPGDDAQQSLVLRRARLQFAGNMWGKHYKYKAEFAFSARDLGFKDGHPTKTPVLSWLIDFTHIRDLNVRVGQYKLGFNRQRVLSSGNQQMVDRSLGNGEFNIDRDIGFEFSSRDLFGLNRLKYRLGVFTGEGRDAYQLSDFDLMGLARIEWLPFGVKVDGKKWKDYAEADLSRSPSPRLSVGAAYAFFDDARKDKGNRGKAMADGGSSDIGVAEFDFIYKQSGCSAMAEVYHRSGTRNAGSAVDDAGNLVAEQALRAGYGWFAQGGCLLPGRPIEFAGRYSEVKPIGGAAGSALSEKYEAGAAISWYIAKHAFKLQADYFRLWDKDGVGEGDNRVRVQLQMAL